MNRDKLILDCINFLKLLDKMLAENKITKEEHFKLGKLKRVFLKDCGIDY